jgi:hypothetical protein
MKIAKTETQFGFEFDFVQLSFRQHHEAIALLESLMDAGEKSKLFASIEKAFSLCVASSRPVDSSSDLHPLDVLTLPEVTKVVGMAIAANNVSEEERKK